MSSLSNKKRKLSPTPSSPSSSTPGLSTPGLPSIGLIPVSASSPQSDGLSSYSNGLDLGSGLGSGLLGDQNEAGPSRAGSVGTETTEAALTPTPTAAPVPGTGNGLVSGGDAIARRTEMRRPTLVAGSGDGVGYGEECFSWTDWPTQNGYRYVPCALSPIPSPNPAYPFHRSIPPPVGTPNVHLSWLDRSPHLKLSSDSMTATSDRGFRSVRSNMSVREGTWYYEVLIERGDGNRGIGKGTGGGEIPNAHIRVGWGRREAIVDAPVGFDGYSYGIRDTGCEKLHLARRKPYGSEPDRHLITGDIIGCLITLPTRPNEIKKRMDNPDDPAHIRRARAPLKFKGQWYLESKEYEPTREMEAMVDREGKLAKAAREELAREPTSDDKENGGGGVAKVSKGKTKQTTTKSKGKDKLQKEDGSEGNRVPTKLEGSSISFYLNGQPISETPAFENLFDFIPLLPPNSILQATNKKGDPPKGILHDDGTLGYYPMISVFGRGKVRANFGPDWLAPPPIGTEARPMCDRWSEFRREEEELDEKEEMEWVERIQKEMKADEIKREAMIKRKLAADAKRLVKSGSASTSASSRGRGKAHGGTGTSTPARSRLATSVTPGPITYPHPNGGVVDDTPASPPRDGTPGVGVGIGIGNGIKTELDVESVIDIDMDSRGVSPKLDSATSPRGEQQVADEETRPSVGLRTGDSDADGESEEDKSIFN